MSETLLAVEALQVHFRLRRTHLLRPAPTVHAVDGVSFVVRRGTTFGIVGESGCGKSTTALATLRLIEPTAGSIRFDGVDVTKLDARSMRKLRQRMQIIFQDPYSSLNPRDRVGEIVAQPMRLLTDLEGAARQRRVAELFERVGMRPEQRQLYPHQFSGGQRQRIGIARALAASPDLIVCDEPVSALDVAIQAQILNLLVRLQRDLGLTYLFISHDLAVVQHICDDIAVMYLGRIVERTDRRSLYGRPLHPYTIALLSADPVKDPALKNARVRIPLQGDAPSPLHPPPGCRFHTRCPYVEERCRVEVPELRQVVRGRWVACHLVRVERGQAFRPHGSIAARGRDDAFGPADHQGQGTGPNHEGRVLGDHQ